MKQRAFLVKYRPQQWGGYEPGQRGDLWPLPGFHDNGSPREPVIHDDPPRRADLLVWQDSPRRRLMGHGVVTATQLEWMDEDEYGSPGEDGEYYTHDAAWWFKHRVRLWLSKTHAPRIESARDNEWTAYPYRHVSGLSGQAAIVPIPLPMAARFIKSIERAS